MSQQLSFNLGLASIPETTNVEMFPEILRLYNAIKITATQLDLYTGNAVDDVGDSPSTIKTTQINNLYTANLICGADLELGRLVGIEVSTGNLVLPSFLTPVLGIMLEDGVEGELGKVLLHGFITADEGTFTAGYLYRHYMNGYMLKESEIPSNYWSYQVIGRALDSSTLFFSPDMNFGAYTTPP